MEVPLSNYSDEELLEYGANFGSDVLATLEMMRRLKEETGKQQRVMNRLTGALVFLTIVILILAAFEAGAVIDKLVSG